VRRRVRLLWPIVQRRYAGSFMSLARFLPDRSNAPALAAPWAPFTAAIPADLRDVPGERRDGAEEERVAREAPLQEFFALHREAQEFIVEHGKRYVRPVLPRLGAAIHAIRRATARQPDPARAVVADDPAELTAAVRAAAERIGISRIGFAPNDARYTFAETDAPQLPTVIVCIVEQDWAMTQTAPSDAAEMAAFHGYVEGMNRTAQLTRFLVSRGYRTIPQGFPGDGIAIHYGVQAGLGQLGLNGQLLTPEAGSRCRLLLITTDAPLVHGAPVDFGLHGVCDQCRGCVRNCPVGAIPQTRKPYRGVVKAKLNTARCLPVVVSASGCAVCMKVCPVQRYGLSAILEHREQTGEILGLGTDELEGYDWPLDGRHYGPGETPKLGDDVTRPKGLVFDPTRVAPEPGIHPITFVGDITPRRREHHDGRQVGRPASS